MHYFDHIPIIKFSKNLKNQHILSLLILITVAGFTLRVYDIGFQPLWIDEAYSVTAAMGIMSHGVPVMPSGTPYTRSLVYTYLVASSMALFGTNAFAARLPALFFGALTIPLAYFFTRKFFDKETALITAFLVAFATIDIAFSRQVRMYQQFQFFYLLSLYLFMKFEKEPNPRNLSLLALSTTLAVLSHGLGFSLLVVYALYASLTGAPEVINAFIKRGSSDTTVRALKKHALLGIFILLAVLFGEWQYGAVTRILATDVNYLSLYLNYLKYAFPVLLYLVPLGAVIALRGDVKEPLLLLLLGIAVPFYFVAFHELMVGFRYLYLFFPLLFMLSSKTITYFSGLLWNPLSRILPAFTRGFPIVLILFILPSLTFFPKTTYYLEPSAPQPRFDSVYTYLQEHAREDDVLIVSYPEVALWYNMAPDYWLAFSISGFPSTDWMDDTHEVYERTNTPAITSLAELRAIYEAHPRGFIVLDSLSGSRILPEYWDFIVDNTMWLEGPSKPGAAGGINIYAWDKEE